MYCLYIILVHIKNYFSQSVLNNVKLRLKQINVYSHYSGHVVQVEICPTEDLLFSDCPTQGHHVWPILDHPMGHPNFALHDGIGEIPGAGPNIGQVAF